MSKDNEAIEEMVTITKQEYQRLLEREYHFSYLEGRGVDNWQGYGYPSCFHCEELKLDAEEMKHPRGGWYDEMLVCGQCKNDPEFLEWYAKEKADTA